METHGFKETADRLNKLASPEFAKQVVQIRLEGIAEKLEEQIADVTPERISGNIKEKKGSRGSAGAKKKKNGGRNSGGRLRKFKAHCRHRGGSTGNLKDSVHKEKTDTGYEVVVGDRRETNGTPTKEYAKFVNAGTEKGSRKYENFLERRVDALRPQYQREIRKMAFQMIREALLGG